MADHCCLKTLLCGDETETATPATALGELPGQTVTSVGVFPAHGSFFPGEAVTVRDGRLQFGRPADQLITDDPVRRSGPLLLPMTGDAEYPVAVPEIIVPARRVVPVTGWFHSGQDFYTLSLLRENTTNVGVLLQRVRSISEPAVRVATIVNPDNWAAHAGYAQMRPGAADLTWIQALFTFTAGGSLIFDRYQIKTYTLTATAAGLSAPVLASDQIVTVTDINGYLDGLVAASGAVTNAPLSLYALQETGSVAFTAQRYGSVTRLQAASALPTFVHEATQPSGGTFPALSGRLTVGGLNATGLERGAVWVTGTLSSGTYPVQAYRLKDDARVGETAQMARSGTSTGGTGFVRAGSTEQPASAWLPHSTAATYAAALADYLSSAKLKTGVKLTASGGAYVTKLRFPGTFTPGQRVRLALRFQKGGAQGGVTAQIPLGDAASSGWVLHSGNAAATFITLPANNQALFNAMTNNGTRIDVNLSSTAAETLYAASIQRVDAF